LTCPAGSENLLDELVENEKMADPSQETISILKETGKKYGTIVFED